MLTDRQIQKSSDKLVGVYREIEDEILTRLGKQLAKGDLSAPAEYQAMQLASNAGVEVGEVLATSKRKIETTASSTIKSVSGGALAKEAAYIGAEVPKLMQDKLGRIAETAARRYTGSNVRVVNGTMQAFNRAVDKAVTSVATGLLTPEKALEQACKALGSDGMTIADVGGKTWQMEDVVRRNIRTECNQTALSSQMELYQEVGQDLVETSAHAHARPEHAEWQGQVFSLTGSGGYENFYEVTGYGEVDGLGGVNCAHGFGAYDPDSGQRYTQDPNQGEDNDEGYKLDQKQRYQERKIRELKRQKQVLEGAGLPTDRTDGKIAERQANIRSLISQSGSQRRPDLEK